MHEMAFTLQETSFGEVDVSQYRWSKIMFEAL